MNRKTLAIIVGLVLVQLVTLALVLPLVARAKGDAPQAGAPAQFTYQGYLTDGDSNPIAGNTNLRFQIYDQQNGGTLEWGPVNSTIDVQDGYFSVELSPGVNVFDEPNRWLEVSVDDGGGYTALPRQRIGAVPYALQASTVNLGNVVIVAQSGGDYNTIQAAIDSITDASATNLYLIWIGPGVYEERVTLDKDFIFMQGAGIGATILQAAGGSTASTGAVGIYTNARYERFENLNIEVSGSAANFGIINRDNALAQIFDIRIDTSGEATAMYNYNATAYIWRSVFFGADIGLGNYNGTGSGPYQVRFRNGFISGSTASIYNSNLYDTLIATSQVSGGPVNNNGGTLTCAGVYDENFTFSANTCP